MDRKETSSLPTSFGDLFVCGLLLLFFFSGRLVSLWIGDGGMGGGVQGVCDGQFVADR